MASFKSLHKPQVRGGRWKIRKKNRQPWEPEDLKVWMARTDGKAKRWNRSFHTHDQAVRWAHFVSLMYKLNSKETADAIIKEYQRRTSDD